MRLKYYREKLGWTQTRLERESGVSQSTISEIEAGKKEPMAPTIRKLASALKVTATELLEDGNLSIASGE